MDFCIGDLVTGTPQSNDTYGVTNSNGVYEVIKLGRIDDNIRIKVIDHKIYPSQLNKCFWVRSKYFVLASYGSTQRKMSFATTLFD